MLPGSDLRADPRSGGGMDFENLLCDLPKKTSCAAGGEFKMRSLFFLAAAEAEWLIAILRIWHPRGAKPHIYRGYSSVGRASRSQ